jgi:hypothetical protein
MQFRWRAQFIAILLFEALLSFNCGQSSSPDSPTLPPPDVSVSISPTTSAVATGQSLQLSASVIGASQTAVTWSIISPASNAGTISSTGLYTAPATALATPVTIRATSVANTSKSATATVWVIAPGQVSPTINVLVAQYTMTLPDGAKMKVEFGPDTSYGLSTWQQSPPSGGGTVNMLVAGMRASTTYHMRAVVALPDGAVFQDVDHSFQTGTLPATRVPQITVTPSGTLQPNPGVEKITLNNLATQFSSNNPLQAIVTDLQGNVIWYYDVDPTGTANLSPLPYRFLPNGHVLVNAVVVGIAGDGIGGDLREIDLAGNIIREMNADELNRRLASAGYNLTISAIHHDFCLLPNGHVILLINHWKDFTDLVGYTGTVSVLGDALIDLDQNWNPVWVWDTFDHLDVNRHPKGLPDWTHGNAIIYSPYDGNLLYSSRHQSWVIKIDYEEGKGSGDVLWKFGYQGDFTLDSGAPAAWMYGQHDIRFLSPNSTGIFTLGLFDNGYTRVLDDNGDLCGTTGQPACYSRVPFFQVDEAGRTAHVLWEDSPLDYSEAVGSMDLLPNGDVEFDEGFLRANPFNSRVMEVTKEPTPQLVWELDVTGQIGYRIRRIPSLYPGVQW